MKIITDKQFFNHNKLLAGLRSRTVAITVSLLIIAWLFSALPVPISAGAGSSGWTQYQGDAVRSGITTDLAPVETPLLSWSRYTWNSGSTGIESPSIISGDIIYTHAGNGLWAFDTLSGEIVWHQEVPGTASLQTSTPACGDGKVFIATGDGYIRAYDALLGTGLWSVKISDVILQCPVTFHEDRIYIGQGGSGGSTNSYFCLDTDGNIVWEYSSETVGYLWSGASVVGDYIVFANHDAILTCLNRHNGTRVDSLDLDTLEDYAGKARASVSYHDGYVYTTSEAGLYSGYIWKIGFNPESGKFNPESGWHNPVGFSTSTPVVYDGKVYVGKGEHGTGGSLVCLDDASGEVLWSYAVEGGVKSSPILSIREEGPYIYFNVSMDDGSLCCLRQDGSLAWSWNPPGDDAYILQGVSLAAGQIYLGTCSGYLYCLEEKPDWPQFQVDAQHSGITTALAPVESPALDWYAFTHYRSTHGIDVVPAVADGKVFVIDVDGYAWAFAAASGDVIWSVELEDDTRFSLASPAWADGKVFFATDKGYIYGMDAGNGEILWSGRLTEGINQNAELNTQLVYQDGRIYVGSLEGKYYCLDAEGDGGQPSVLWTWAVENKRYDWYSAASIAGDFCLFGDTDGIITCLNKNSGDFVSSLDLNDLFDIDCGSIRSGISFNETRDCLYLTSAKGYLVALGFDPDSGAFNPLNCWNYPIDSYSTSTPVYHDGRIYVCSGGSFPGQEGGLYCLDKEGNLVWHNDIAGETYGSQASPALSVQGDDLYIYITTGEPRSALVCLDGDGEHLWSYVPPYTEYTLQGAAVYDGRVYFVNDAGYLYAITSRQAWDVDGNSEVNVLDMVLVGNHFAETGQSGWIPEDVNRDGRIDVLDLIVIGNHFHE